MNLRWIDKSSDTLNTDVDADTNKEKAIRERGEYFNPSQTKGVSNVVLCSCLGSEPKAKEGDYQ